MIDVSPYIPELHKLMNEGDFEVQPACRVCELYLSLYTEGKKTKSEVLAAAENSKLEVIDMYHTHNLNANTYSYNTAVSTINAIITAFE